VLYTSDGSEAIIEQNIIETDGSMICSRRADTNYYWYRQDIRGSVTNIVDVDDDVVKGYTYDAYGNTTVTGTFINSTAYTGAVIDAETGLYYMNARYYEPETGRFISQDTYRGKGESFWHLYAYCNGDPVNNTDPTGHLKTKSYVYFKQTKKFGKGSSAIITGTVIYTINKLAFIVLGTMAEASYKIKYYICTADYNLTWIFSGIIGALIGGVIGTAINPGWGSLIGGAIGAAIGAIVPYLPVSADGSCSGTKTIKKTFKNGIV
jgi:RHS repeat-associated protein